LVAITVPRSSAPAMLMVMEEQRRRYAECIFILVVTV
jgi:hypothetical protein